MGHFGPIIPRMVPFAHLSSWYKGLFDRNVFPLAGIPVDEDEDEQDTSIKGRLLALLYKIKGPPQKTEEPTEKEQAAPSKLLWTGQYPSVNASMVGLGWWKYVSFQSTDLCLQHYAIALTGQLECNIMRTEGWACNITSDRMTTNKLLVKVFSWWRRSTSQNSSNTERTGFQAPSD